MNSEDLTSQIFVNIFCSDDIIPIEHLMTYDTMVHSWNKLPVNIRNKIFEYIKEDLEKHA